MPTPSVGMAWQTSATAGVSTSALAANLTGGYISNPINAPASLYVDPTGPASITANGTTMAIIPGQTYFAIAQSTLPVSVASPMANHQFIAVQW